MSPTLIRGLKLAAVAGVIFTITFSMSGWAVPAFIGGAIAADALDALTTSLAEAFETDAATCGYDHDAATFNARGMQT